MYRVVVNHFPLWALNPSTQVDVTAGLNTDLLPLLRAGNFDLYLTAHEGVTSFAHIRDNDNLDTKLQPEFDTQLQSAEYWFKSAGQERFRGFDQG